MVLIDAPRGWLFYHRLYIIYGSMQSIGTHTKLWYLVDARNQVAGRLAAMLSLLLQGKTKPIYHPASKYMNYILAVSRTRTLLVNVRIGICSNTATIHYHYPPSGWFTQPCVLIIIIANVCSEGSATSQESHSIMCPLLYNLSAEISVRI